MTKDFKSGFMAVVGRPNVGKSTLINSLAKEKLAIVSDKPQTTRNTIRAVVNKANAQLVLIDTPGLHKPKDEFSNSLNKKTHNALTSVDVIALMVDASKIIGSGDCFIADKIADIEKPKILLLNKVDLISKEEIKTQLEVASHIGSFEHIISISSKDGDGLQDFLSKSIELLPEGPRYYPEGMITDQPEEKIIEEFIREKVCRHTREEIPHSVFIDVTEMEPQKNKDIVKIWADVVVERESQKGIVIGKGARMLKEIGKEARVDIENLLGSQVYLELRVKVKKNWRKKAVINEGTEE